MKMRGLTIVAATAVALGLAGIAGCGGAAGPKTYPVKGQVTLAGGEIRDLAGHSVEAALDTEPSTRAFSQILPDGSFTLETLQAGSVQQGAAAGTYRVRIVLSEDDPEARRRAAQLLHPRFLQFQTSGLTIQVPSNGPPTLALSKP
jgi:hypothetical protein